MLNRSVIACCVMLLLAMACAAQSSREKQEADRSIRALMEEQTAAWNRGDLEGFMAGYWRSENLTFVSNKVTKGWQQTLDNYKRSYPTREAMGTLTFSDLEITVISKDAALVHGSWALKRAQDEPKGKFTLLFRKIARKWVIVHDHSS